MKTINDYLEMYDLTIERIVEKAYRATKKQFCSRVDFCSIVSAKTGGCSENCKYCAQSAASSAKIEIHPMMSPKEVKKAALSAKKNGATRFGVVTSGKKPTKEDFEKLLEIVKEVSSIEGLRCCVCAGILDENQFSALKEAGCIRYNHNINTSEEYYDKICTTHTFEDRIRTIKLAKKCGLEVCAGVIIGMGETREDRINMALALKKLRPEGVPINFLDPIKGTELENCTDKIDKDEIIKTICIFRMILPKASLIYAGGRTVHLDESYQILGLMAGITGIIVGNYLTTTGADIKQDLKMLEIVGMKKNDF